MQPFTVGPSFLDHYPSPAEFRNMLVSSTRSVKESVARQWLSEGVPAAFRDCPGVYEHMRAWLSHMLAPVQAKEITLVGSTRIGFSLSDFGRPFTEDSDLDLCVVSTEFFDSFVDAFSRFEEDFRSGNVTPRSPREHMLWESNVTICKQNIALGFVDANKLPTFDRYKISQKVQNSMWLLGQKLAITPTAPRVKRASVRIYRDWNALVARLTLNLIVLSRKLSS